MLELFLAKRETAGLAPVTLAGYRRTITHFVTSPGIPASPADWSDEHVDLWLHGLRKRINARTGRPGLAPASIAHEQRNLFAFLGFLWDREETSRDIRKRVERVKVPETRGRVATAAMVEALLLSAYQGRNALRDAAIVRTLWSTGIRRSELAQLDLCHVDFKAGELRLPAEMTKGKRFARVPFDSPTKAALLEYIADDRKESPGPLFLSARGGRLLSHGMAAMLFELGKRAEVEVSSHDFRRGFAVRALRGGMEISQVARILRHETLAMTLAYGEEGLDDAAVAAYRERIG